MSLPAASRATKTSSGFTLVEVLVSMSLMGLVAVAVLFGFRVGTNAWAKGGTSLERFRTTQATFDLLSRQIGSMKAHYSMQKIREAPVELLLFQGAEAGMRFVSSFSLKARSSGGLWLVEYFVTKSKETEQVSLVLNETPLPHDEQLSESLFSEIEIGESNRPVVLFPEFRPARDAMRLVENAQDIQFRYFLPLSQEGQGLVSGKEQLPQGVEILMRWSEPGLLDARNFSVVVPIHASVKQ